MSSRSLKFQLIVWYAGLLAGCFVVLGAAVYFALQSYLVSALKHTQLRRAGQIAMLLAEESRHGSVTNVGPEVEARYAPSSNARFVRVSRGDGEILYASATPADGSFTVETLPPPGWPSNADGSRQVPLPDGHKILLAAHTIDSPAGRFLVETGAPMAEVEDDLHQWLIFLMVGLPIAALVSVGGGYFLIKRALTPVDRIAASAERISSHNLSERLPVPRTADELERLSTALNRMIQRLEEAFHYSRRFVADASHELRTPLTVLRGELESLADEDRLPPDLKDRVGSALEEVERLVNIVEGLFAISRLDAGEAQAEWVKFDLAKLAGSTADQMSLLAEDKNIKVTCQADQEVWVEGDRARMKQIVVNLLDNAIKYTPQEGKVALKVEAQGNKALLEISDNGIGIPPEALSLVFDRFFRVDKARSREQGGAGLGLSIVKSICAAHHGEVVATSEPGKGSRFCVALPLVSHPTRNGH